MLHRVDNLVRHNPALPVAAAIRWECVAQTVDCRCEVPVNLVEAWLES